MYENKELENRFSNIDNPVLHGLINSLLIDSKTGCVLLGQRNEEQVNILPLLRVQFLVKTLIANSFIKLKILILLHFL